MMLRMRNKWGCRRRLSVAAASSESARRAQVYRLLLGLDDAAGSNNVAARLTPMQQRAVDFALRGYSVFLHLPTGAGKSIAFQAPALLARPSSVTIVVSPLVALLNVSVCVVCFAFSLPQSDI